MSIIVITMIKINIVKYIFAFVNIREKKQNHVKKIAVLLFDYDI